MDEFRLHDALAALLADHGRPALLALALACAELVLPLYEAAQPGDSRLRRALGPPIEGEELTAAHAALAETLLFGHYPKHVRDAAAAAYAAASLSFWHSGASATSLLTQVVHCVQTAADAVAGALRSGSAQERLDFVQQRMEGFSSFDAWLTRCLELAEEVGG